MYLRIPLLEISVLELSRLNCTCVYHCAGSGVGTVQLVNVYSGQVDREYKIFMAPVRYLEWVDAGRIIAYSYPDPPSYGNKLVKSEVVLLNIKSGMTKYVNSSFHKLF